MASLVAATQGRGEPKKSMGKIIIFIQAFVPHIVTHIVTHIVIDKVEEKLKYQLFEPSE